jgi:hypothetical protein
MPVVPLTISALLGQPSLAFSDCGVCCQWGKGIAALPLVLIPAENVPPEFAATAIGLTTLN